MVKMGSKMSNNDNEIFDYYPESDELTDDSAFYDSPVEDNSKNVEQEVMYYEEKQPTNELKYINDILCQKILIRKVKASFEEIIEYGDMVETWVPIPREYKL